MAFRILCILLFLILPLISSPLFSQKTLQEHKYRLQLPARTQIVFDQKLETPRVISFQEIAQEDQFHQRESTERISQFFDFSGSDQLAVIREEKFTNELSIKRFKRYHDGIKVEHGDYVVFSKRDTVLSIHSEHYSLAAQVRSSKLSEKQALAFALAAFFE